MCGESRKHGFEREGWEAIPSSTPTKTPDPRRLILTESGLERLNKAIDQKLKQEGKKRTYENISALTEGTGNTVSVDTVSKILKCKKPVGCIPVW
ncbi:MAG: hypothetical protein EBE86_026150 [Hormoscilla sp. GUM202]|nr:hypothetical protein [Hormoscilla sp. GUM202]